MPTSQEQEKGESRENPSGVKLMRDFDPGEVANRLNGRVIDGREDPSVIDCDGVRVVFSGIFIELLWTRVDDPSEREVWLTDGAKLQQIGNCGVVSQPDSLMIVNPSHPDGSNYSGIQLKRGKRKGIGFQVSKKSASKEIKNAAELSEQNSHSKRR